MIRRAPRSGGPKGLLAACLGCAAAAVPIAAVYGWASFVPAALAALVLGVATAAVRRRRGALTAALLVDVLVGVVAAVPDRAAGVLPTIDGGIAFAVSAVTGWREVLTAATPLGSDDGLVVPAYLVLLLGTAIAATGGRRAVAGPLLIAGFGAVIGVGSAPDVLGLPAVLVDGGLLLGGVLVVGAANATAVRVVSGERRTAVVLLGLCAAAGIGIASVTPFGADRLIVRDEVQPPIDVAAVGSPLTAFRGWFDAGSADAVLFTATGVAAGTRFSLATVDDYDGVVLGLRSGARSDFRRLPTDNGADDDVRITIEALNSVWVPLPNDTGAPQLSGSPAVAYYSASDGAALTEPPLTAGSTVRVARGSSTWTDPEELVELTPGDAPKLRDTTASDVVDAYVDDSASGADGPGERLGRVLASVLERGYLSHGVEHGGAASRPGHSIARLDEVLGTAPMVGDDEQYAVLAALFADRTGFPARVGVGFVAEAAADGSVVVRGRDAVAWLEVDTAERGWVSIDVTPERTDAPQRAPEVPAPTARPQAVVEPPVPERQRDESGSQDGGDVDPTPPPSVPAAMPWLPWSVAGLLLLMLPPVSVVAFKSVRRRRRRAAGPRAGLLGAWHEYLDAATDRGVAPPPGGTRLDVARALTDPRALTLARIADRAAFDPLPIPDGESARVWAALPELRRGLRPEAPRSARLRWALSTASIRRPARRYDSGRKGRTR